MSEEKALEKIGNKYLCMTSGQKRMEPCDGCSNPKGCLSRAMQYKETEEMDQQEEKAILKVSADGDVVSCAKGLEAKECGFKGGKVCGACGAMAVMSKDAEETVEEVAEEVEAKVDDVVETEVEEKAMPVDAPDMVEGEEDEESDDDEDMEEDEKGMKKKAEPEGEMPEDGDDEEEDEEDEESGDGEMAMKKKAMVEVEVEAEEDDEEEEEEEEDAEPQGNAMAPTMEGRMRAIKRVAGKKSDELNLEDSYICQFERKAFPNDREVCANCPGGCAAEGNMPGIADIEGMALDMFGGKVLASGYTGTEEDDFGNLFVVDIMSKDGHAIEIIADGDTGELLNFHRLNTENIEAAMGQKSLEGEIQSAAPKYVSIKIAEEIALGVVESEIETKGMVVQADSDIFEGFDSWVFEIDAVNGKSYDVFVSLDGHVLGYDEYDAAEAQDIEAEAAELALKRAYSEDQREEMAKEGMAMEDGSFPIKDVADLRNAIQAYGRAKDKEKAKAHIMKRALDLGQEDLIPENWVPKKIQEEAQAAEKSADVVGSDQDSQLMKDLLEFEMLTAEEELKKFL